MPATIIGSPGSGKKVLRRQSYQKDINGLETLSETYIVRNTDLISLVPAKDVTHFAYSTATTKFKRMAVESTSTSEQDGGISELSVTFVGLTAATGLPPAIVRILPVAGAGSYGPPINIEAEFVSDSQESEIVVGKLSSTAPIIPKGFFQKQRMPAFINGTKMPENPKPPYNNSRLVTSSGGSLFVRDVTDRYEGYVIRDIDCVRRGQFLVARITFEEFRYFAVS